MRTIHVPEPIEIVGKSIFLAGPTPRQKEVESWRPEAIRLFEECGFAGTILVPEGRTETWCKDYTMQIEWESAGLTAAEVILFWVPRNLETMPGLTTNDEFGYWRAKAPKKIVFGAPTQAVKVGYQMYHCEKLGIPMARTLDQAVWLSILHGEI